MIDPNELVWVARYKDGSFSTQYNVDGSYRDRYADIVRDQLSDFELWSADGKRLILRLHFDTPEQKLVYRRKVYKKPGIGEFYVYLAGWQVKVGGRNVNCLCFVFPDGHVEQVSDWKKASAYFDQPTIHPWEGEDWEINLEELTEEQIATIKQTAPHLLEDKV